MEVLHAMKKALAIIVLLLVLLALGITLFLTLLGPVVSPSEEPRPASPSQAQQQVYVPLETSAQDFTALNEAVSYLD